MKNNYIILKNVDLHYASTAFKERSLKSLLAKATQPRRNKTDINNIHALKNISIDIPSGQRIGLLGHNGAGKSTFLKVLAGLYPITRGSRSVNGKIRSLFDLSLGFEPEATGRENILYRSLLLGLNPKEVKIIEDEIIEFADIGNFIDYPIKTYSSGMQVRLAFAISTAIGGDILLVDEVIGAGDENFMNKAKLRIEKLIKDANIFVLASHDYNALQSLCDRGIVLHHGELMYDGAIELAINYYKSTNGLKT